MPAGSGSPRRVCRNVSGSRLANGPLRLGLGRGSSTMKVNQLSPRVSTLLAAVMLIAGCSAGQGAASSGPIAAPPGGGTAAPASGATAGSASASVEPGAGGGATGQPVTDIGRLSSLLGPATSLRPASPVPATRRSTAASPVRCTSSMPASPGRPVGSSWMSSSALVRLG